MFDKLIKGGTVVDGTGAPAFTADAAIADGRIVDVGKLSGRARQIIGADGLLVAPGWIDIHTHYDGQVTWDSQLAPSFWHGVTSVKWETVDSAPLEAALLKEADGLVDDEAGFLVIDDTALPKKGCHSVGVAPQYASSLGKTANCQSLVSVTLASREVPVMVGLRLFLPESWTDDPERMARAGVPKDGQTALTKPEIAIEEIDRVIASGARFGCVLADSGYGSSGSFRQALSERGLLWAVGLSRR